ncbi:hypothetical protein [Streptomyces gelaticus]|nr:hypothetical protein [Streptomyces gelaticus]
MAGTAVGTDRTGIDTDGAAPAHGQLVTVRNRPWVVTEVTRSAVSSEEPARTAAASAPHLLLELNHARYKKEQEAGFHVPDAKKKAAPKRAPKPKTEPKPEDGIQDGIF